MDTGLGAKAYAIIEQGKIGLILSSRPTDRRQLIEEAAGITKYKARRRAAELKLEAAQQNLTRIDDIVFEVEKQRGSLKRQAAKARRYTRLRDEMRRWEKVLFARRYRALGEVIESARARLAETREQEAAAAARLAEVENELGRAAHRAGRSRIGGRQRARGGARPRARDQSAAAADRARRAAGGHAADARRRARDRARDARGAPRARAARARGAARAPRVEAERPRDEAAARRRGRRVAEHARAQQAIEAAEQDVERARAEVYAVMNTVTALTAALEAATAQRERAAEALGRLEVEAADLQHRARPRRRRAHRPRSDALAARARERSTRRGSRARRANPSCASARIEHEWRARDVRSREHELASLTARLRSLEELDAHRAGFSDAARMVLVQANGRVGQMGALADFIEVEPRYERAVEACLGDLLQHVLVRRHEHAAAGLALVREQDAGRCGFIVVGPMPTGAGASDGACAVRGSRSASLRACRARCGAAVERRAHRRRARDGRSRGHRRGGHRRDVRRGARAGARRCRCPSRRSTATSCAARIWSTGGGKVESRGILATKREIKELRERVARRARGARAARRRDGAVRADDRARDRRHRRAVVRAASPGEGASSPSRRSCSARPKTRRGWRSARELVASETGARARRDRRARRPAGRSARVDRPARRASGAPPKRVLARRAADADRRARTRRRAGAACRRGARDARRARRAQRGGRRRRATGSRTAARELERRVETCATDLTLMRDQRERLLARRRRRPRG